MKVSNSEQSAVFKDNEDLLKRLNQGLTKKISSKEQEIKQIDELYDKKIEAAKMGGEQDYLQSLDRNKRRIVDESNITEEKIQGYREQLKKAQEHVANEQVILKTEEKAKLDGLKTELENNFQDQSLAAQENQRDVQSSTQNAIQEIATKSKSEKSRIEINSQSEINALSSDLNQKASDVEKNFREQIDMNMRLHNSEVSRQREDLKKLMMVDTEKSKRLSDEKNRVHTSQLSFQDKHQEDMLKQRDQDFKIRYEQIVKEHDTILKNLTTHFQADVKKMVEQTANDKKIINERNDDPFYRVDKLSPKMTDELKEVIVSMPVAEYEKENVHLSAQGRDIKITLSRKYSDNMIDTDGSNNRSTRNELYSREFTSKDILNPREITQMYENGILTFKIKKA